MKDYNAEIEEDINESYQKGKQDMFNRIMFIIGNRRTGLNNQRGGRPCHKEYLQPVNNQIDILDQIIDELKNIQI